MLKRMSIRKIMVSSLALFALLLLYLIPDNSDRELKIDNSNVEYVYDNTVESIYLLDSNDYVARTSIATCNCDSINVARELISGLTLDGGKSSIIPNGFKPIIPAGTSILDIKLEDNILFIDFSSELMDIKNDYEEKMIESLIYTLTSVDGIDKVKIQVEGKDLNKLPHSGKILPTVLDKSYGINKKFEITSLKDIDSYTVYYVSSYNDNKYYVPVTRYINNKGDNDKIKIIVDELAAAPIYETNLMSYLNGGTELLDYKLEDGILKLNFNNSILDDIASNNILEEVIYTISLSVQDLYSDVQEVDFLVENEEIYKNLKKSIE
jgi:germination protein M